MDVDQLELFVAVYSAGGFAPVARARNVAPSSVSRAVAALEKDLNIRLFQRTTRRLAPTQAGEALFRRLHPLLNELDAAIAEATAMGAEPAGRLRVSCSTSYGAIVIAPLIKEFCAAFPKINLDLILADAVVDLISEQIDMAIRHGSVLPDSDFTGRKLSNVCYYLVASPTYVDRFGAPQSPAEVSHHRLIVFPYSGFRTSWRFRDAYGVEETVGIEPDMTISNASTMLKCVSDGVGIALLADWTVNGLLESGDLVRLLPEWDMGGAAFDAAIWLLFPSRRYIPSNARAFADFLTNKVGR